jgi:hypothetical protein
MGREVGGSRNITRKKYNTGICKKREQYQFDKMSSNLQK